ncbi:MAG TPA: DUF2231 domain-containing protein [Terriglobales bacterium]|nr:DUF2231 domain-containing protein [Terriglobales bacterium]
MNPFDPRQALLARHAQHVVLIHFPIALFLAGAIFDALARWHNRAALATAAYYNFFAAALSTPAAIATGLLAWQFQLEGRKLKGILLQHLALAVAATLLIWLVWYLYFRARRSRQEIPPLYYVCVEIFAVIVVTLAGHLGGFLSGINGPS